MRTRSAISIAELLVTMSACSVILSMSAGLIHWSLHTQSRSDAFYDAERSVLRLGRQFRRDVHASTSASLAAGDGSEDAKLRLQLPDSQAVEYIHSDVHVRRLLWEGGKVAAREDFAFPSSIEFDIHKTESPLRIILSITTQRVGAAGARAMACDTYVEAALNRPHIAGESQ